MSKNKISAPFWTNYHGHSFFCDGHESPEAYVKAAIEKGMQILGISSHAPVPYDTDWNMKNEKLPEYLHVINDLKEKYSDQIKLLLSLEVDYIPELAGPAHPLITSSELDYIVGSVHFVDTFENTKPFSIDDSTDDFEKGVNEIFNGDIRKAVNRYFHLQREMLEQQPPHILGHMDKIRMHNRNRFFFDESADWYLREVYETLKLAAEKGTVVEINAKYFAVEGLSFPARNHFKWMAENNIPVTLSSDAHKPQKLVSGFSDLAPLMKENGFKNLWQFDDKKFVPKKFEVNGILWN